MFTPSTVPIQENQHLKVCLTLSYLCCSYPEASLGFRNCPVTDQSHCHRSQTTDHKHFSGEITDISEMVSRNLSLHKLGLSKQNYKARNMRQDYSQNSLIIRPS